MNTPAFENGDEVYIVASDLVEAVAAKCGLGSETRQKCWHAFPGTKLDRLEARHAWLDRTSLMMVGEYVTLGGEADAETELDVSEAEKKPPTAKRELAACTRRPVMVTTTS